MSIKTVATLVGTLSLSTLATGCATARPTSAASSHEKSGDFGCQHPTAAQKGGSASEAAPATGSEKKGGEHTCGAGGCGARHE